MDKILKKYYAKVLVVEDNILNLELATEMLRLMECEVDSAENGFVALDQFENNKYDIIFMDINMPEKDGIEVTRDIREIEKTKGLQETPIVAITGMDKDIARDQCFEAGMNDFISKPLTTEELDRVLSKCLKVNKV